MPVAEALLGIGAGISHGWAWMFGGAHGPWVEASTVCIATAIATDLVAQSGEMTKETLKEDEEEDKLEQGFDCPRVGRVAVIGSIYGPVEFFYFILMDKTLAWWGQVLFDNICFIPMMTAGGILLNIALRDQGSAGRHKATVCEEFTQKMWDSLKVGLPMWFTLDCFMFTVIPLRHRVAFSRVGGFGYLIWCSHVLNDPHHDPTEKWQTYTKELEEATSRCPSPHFSRVGDSPKVEHAEKPAADADQEHSGTQ
eukprot:TRINITY_DN319_c3_g1_i1.p1 TRINITY_DN319_c3_g1~~TRINITY_DN319_c3_g1_i1.p1  ORF type:complete len:285 (+),score=71.46 TRINITY_DN319_c3_g1_i1:99-857(+)